MAIDTERVETAVQHLPPLVPAGWPEHGPLPHRFASVFRMLTGPEREQFEQDVLDNGLREKIKMFDGAILDGRNRYLAVVAAGFFAPEFDDWEDFDELFENFDGNELEAADFVVSCNEQRRHDNPTQRAVAAARLARVRNMSQAEAAALFGVSERQVSSASHALNHGVPELEAAMDAGRLPGYLAERVADLDEDDQREVAAAPKGEASAKAREKLQTQPPLAESAPVVKPMAADTIVMFAEAVLTVAANGHEVTRPLLDRLAQEHSLLADRDGVFNTRPEFGLAVELARKRHGYHKPRLGNTDLLIATAGLSDDLGELTALYRQALQAFDRAVVANDAEASAKAQLTMEAVLFKANGSSRTGVWVSDAPEAIVLACAVPDGTVPLWGQNGCFEVEAGDIRAIVDLDARYGSWWVKPVDFLAPFPEGSGVAHGYFMGHGGDAFAGMDVAAAGRVMLERAIGRSREKSSDSYYPNGLFYPEAVYRLDPESRSGPVLVQRGMELVAGQWPFTISEEFFRERCKAWRDEAVSGRGKKAFPKPKHLASHIWSIGKDGGVPVADFPVNGAYLWENNGTWRYVDNGTDPGADAVTARVRLPDDDDDEQEEVAAGAVPDRAAYDAALAALTEPKGKLHQTSARPVLEAALAAGVSWRQVAEDIGHPLGTVKTWANRCGLTDMARMEAMNAERKAEAEARREAAE